MEKANIDKTKAWPFVEAKKILRERKKFIDKKVELFFKQAMVQVDYHILEHLEKLQEPRCL